VNDSKHKKYIEQLYIEFPEEINGEKLYQTTNVNHPVNYPQELEPEAKFETQISLCNSLLELINKISDLNKKREYL
jgi:hypothetical protein